MAADVLDALDDVVAGAGLVEGLTGLLADLIERGVLAGSLRG